MDQDADYEGPNAIPQDSDDLQVSNAQPQVTMACGLLFIGDVHLSSRRPGRRKDGYADAVLAKVKCAIDIANELWLVPIFTGDIFHHPRETDEAIKTRLIRILKSCWTVPHSNVGNSTHDTVGSKLADGDSLAVIAEGGSTLIVHREAGPGARFLLRTSDEDEGLYIGVGFSPYAQNGGGIPKDVTGMFEPGYQVIWITHHDIGFEGAYPGSVPPFEIKGCGIVVNGHLHGEKPSVRVGQTQWNNFGSLTRTAVDQIDHIPSVRSLMPGKGLKRHDIHYERDVFDLSGRNVDEASPDEVAEAARDSVFVRLLAEGDSGASPKGSEGAALQEVIEAEFARRKSAEDVRAVVMSLFRASRDAAAI